MTPDIAAICRSFLRGRGHAALLLAVLFPAIGCANNIVIPHALAPAEKVYVCEGGGWGDAVASLPGIERGRVVIASAYDKNGMPSAGLLSAWTTDEWLFARRGRGPVVIKLPGDQGLAAWGREHFAALIADGRYVEPAAARPHGDPGARFDQGGAVLVSPPVPGFPHGRLIVSRGMQPALKDWFRRRTAHGALVELDTGWLKVGHVDELIGFVHAAGRPGFKLVAPDPQAGLALLKSVPAGRACFAASGAREHVGAVAGSAARRIDVAADLPDGSWAFVRIVAGTGAGQVAKVRSVDGRRIVIDRVWDTRDLPGQTAPARGLCRAISGRCEAMPIWFERPDATSRFLLVSGSKMWRDGTGREFPAVIAAGELAGDPWLARVNKTIAARCHAAAQTIQMALGLDGADVVLLPGLFVAPDEGATGAFALTPSLVNLQTIDNAIVLLRPFGPRRDPGDNQTDVFLAAARRALEAAEGTPHFLDGWHALHSGNGGARCGTNVRRGTGP